MSLKNLMALVVEDDEAWQGILTEILSDLGFEVELADNLSLAVAMMRNRPHRLAVVDLSLGGSDHRNQDGIEVLDALTRYNPDCVPLVLTGFATVELAVEVIQEHGAFTCIQKDNFRRVTFRDWVDKAMLNAPGVPVPQSASRESIEPQVTSDSAKRSDDAQKERRSQSALIVEDDAGWRSLLSELALEAGYETELCTSYVEALGYLSRKVYQLTIVDLSLASSILPEPNQDGFLLLAKTRAAHIPTIVVSGFAEPARIERAYFEYGIISCIEKQAFDRDVFIQTIEGARDHNLEDPEIGNLTDREREVLVLISRGYTNKEIAGTINVSTNTVKRHLKSIFAKLDVSTRAAASAKAVRARLVLD